MSKKREGIKPGDAEKTLHIPSEIVRAGTFVHGIDGFIVVKASMGDRVPKSHIPVYAANK